MAPRGLLVTKIPRSSPLPDTPINFPPFDNLHLEMIECKKKVKPNAPTAISRKPRRRKTDFNVPKVPVPGSADEGITIEEFEAEHQDERYDVIDSGNIVDNSQIFEAEHRVRENNRHQPVDFGGVEVMGETKTNVTTLDDEDLDILAAFGDEDELYEIGMDLAEAISDVKQQKREYLRTQVQEDFDDFEEEVVPSPEPRPKRRRRKKKRTEDIELQSAPSEDGMELSLPEPSEDQSVASPLGSEYDEDEDEYAGMTPEEIELKKKQEMLWKFKILRKQYADDPSIEIPSFNIHSDLQLMQDTYNNTIKELLLDDAVSNYRMYLIGGFMAVEYACITFMDIDMRGFTTQQMRMMTRYNRLLIELGEKNAVDVESQFPVEIRLIGLVLLNAGIFYLGKVVQEKFGGKMADIFRGMMGQPPTPSQPPQPLGGGLQESGAGVGTPPQQHRPRRRRNHDSDRPRGPRMTPEEIRQRYA